MCMRRRVICLNCLFGWSFTDPHCMMEMVRQGQRRYALTTTKFKGFHDKLEKVEQGHDRKQSHKSFVEMSQYTQVSQMFLYCAGIIKYVNFVIIPSQYMRLVHLKTGHFDVTIFIALQEILALIEVPIDKVECPDLCNILRVLLTFILRHEGVSGYANIVGALGN